MANIFTSTSLRCPVILLLLLLTIGYVSRFTQASIQCYMCNYDEPIKGPFDDTLRCDVTKPKKECTPSADGCVTVHHDVHKTENGITTSVRQGVGTCLEPKTIKCIEFYSNQTLQVETGKITCESKHFDRSGMLKVQSECFGKHFGPDASNETTWDITAHFCACYGELCNGKGEEPTNNGTGVTKPPPGPVAPPTTGKATRDLFEAWAVMWTALAAEIMREWRLLSDH